MEKLYNIVEGILDITDDDLSNMETSGKESIIYNTLVGPTNKPTPSKYYKYDSKKNVVKLQEILIVDYKDTLGICTRQKTTGILVSLKDILDLGVKIDADILIGSAEVLDNCKLSDFNIVGKNHELKYAQKQRDELLSSKLDKFIDDTKSFSTLTIPYSEKLLTSSILKKFDCVIVSVYLAYMKGIKPDYDLKDCTAKCLWIVNARDWIGGPTEHKSYASISKYLEDKIVYGYRYSRSGGPEDKLETLIKHNPQCKILVSWILDKSPIYITMQNNRLEYIEIKGKTPWKKI